MEYQAKKPVNTNQSPQSLKERLAHIPKGWYVGGLSLVFVILLGIGLSWFAPRTLDRVMQIVGLQQLFVTQTGEQIFEKQVYICTSNGWQVDDTMTEKLQNDALSSMPSTYELPQTYVIGQTVVNYTANNEVLSLDPANCQTACGVYDGGTYYDEDRSGSTLGALTPDVCAGGARLVPDSMSFSLEKGWYWQCGVRNTTVYASCSAEVTYCGDKQVQEGETCDDGNTDPGDGCDACQISTVVPPSTPPIVPDPPKPIAVCAEGEIGSSCSMDMPGACNAGRQVCINNTWECMPENNVAGIDEICGDNLDNDCNGSIDDGCSGGLCCREEDKPGVGANPLCFEGATCCGDGTWKCNGIGPDGTIVSGCGALGAGNVCTASCENPVTKNVEEGSLESTGKQHIERSYTLTNGVSDSQSPGYTAVNPRTCEEAGKLLAQRVCRGSTLMSYDWEYTTCQAQQNSTNVYIEVSGEVICCEGASCDEDERLVGEELGYCRDDSYRANGISNKARCTTSADCGGEYCMFPCYDADGNDYPWAECAIGDVPPNPSVGINLPVGHHSTAAQQICTQALGVGATCGSVCVDDFCEDPRSLPVLIDVSTTNDGITSCEQGKLLIAQQLKKMCTTIDTKEIAIDCTINGTPQTNTTSSAYAAATAPGSVCDAAEECMQKNCTTNDIASCIQNCCSQHTCSAIDICSGPVSGPNPPEFVVTARGELTCCDDKTCIDADNDGICKEEGDCDDTDPTIYPGALELCDGKDNDCSAVTNDGSDAVWLGAACDGSDADQCSDGVYQCQAGTKICTDDTNHVAEVCDNGKDDDCDGVIDEGCNPACPPVPSCPAPPVGCSYESPELDSNNCVIGCGTLTCEPGICTGDIPVDADICPGSDEVPTGETYPWRATDTCDTFAPDYCRYRCPAGYVLEDDTCEREHNVGGGGGGGGGSSHRFGGNNFCGDGVVRNGEECDDGNGIDGDGCDHNCDIEIDAPAPRDLLSDHLKYAIARLEGVCAYDDVNYKDIMFRDVKWDPEHEAINTLLAYCIVKGYDRTQNKKYYIDAASSKAEVIKVLTKTLAMDDGIRFDEKGYITDDLPYRDMRPNHWYSTYVVYAYQMGLLRHIGRETLFGKDLKALTPVTKKEFTQLLENAGVTKRYDALEGYGKYVYREDMANIMVDAFAEKFRDYQYLYGNNVAIYRYVLNILEDKSAENQVRFVRSLISKLEVLNHREMGEKMNIHLRGLVAFLKLLVEEVE